MNNLHTVQLMPLASRNFLLYQNLEWFTFLMPASLGCPGKEALKGVLLLLVTVL